MKPATRLGVALAATAAFAWLGASAASAKRFKLSRLLSQEASGAVIGDEATYAALVTDLTQAIRPGTAGPAATSGALGFELTYATGLTSVSDPGPWAAATGAERDVSRLATSQLVVRTGLPIPMELGLSLGWLHDQDLWTPSLELRVALLEGAERAPDVGARLHIGGLLGHPDMDLLAVGTDLIIGKRFALGGVLKLYPYAGYSFTFGRGTSRPVAYLRRGNVTAEDEILGSHNAFISRGFVGLDLRSLGGLFGVEVSFGGLTTWTLRAGLSL